MGDGSLAGIVTTKDLMYRLVAKGLSASETCVSTLMTKQPDTIPGSATVLQALHQLQLGGYRNLPVLSADGQPLGVLDVLTLMDGALESDTAHHSRDKVSHKTF